MLVLVQFLACIEIIKMNYYNYLRSQLKDNLDIKKNNRKINLLLIFVMVLFVLELVFSCLFVSCFVKLSNFIYANHHQNETYTKTWISTHQALNDALLVSMIVFWVVFIISMIWFIWYFSNLNLRNMKNNQKYHIIFICAFYLNIVSLFICFLGLISLSLTTYYLMKYKENFNKFLKDKNQLN